MPIGLRTSGWAMGWKSLYCRSMIILAIRIWVTHDNFQLNSTFMTTLVSGHLFVPSAFTTVLLGGRAQSYEPPSLLRRASMLEARSKTPNLSENYSCEHTIHSSKRNNKGGFHCPSPTSIAVFCATESYVVTTLGVIRSRSYLYILLPICCTCTNNHRLLAKLSIAHWYGSTPQHRSVFTQDSDVQDHDRRKNLRMRGVLRRAQAPRADTPISAPIALCNG